VLDFADLPVDAGLATHLIERPAQLADLEGCLSDDLGQLAPEDQHGDDQDDQDLAGAPVREDGQHRPPS